MPSGTPRTGPGPGCQIVYGLLTSRDGVPVAIEVFAGNTGDPKTVAAQVTRVKDRFGITRVVLVGDRGMLTAARLREDVRPAHLDWITALRAPQVKKVVRDGDLQLTLFDVQDLAEITSPDFPGGHRRATIGYGNRRRGGQITHRDRRVDLWDGRQICRRRGGRVGHRPPGQGDWAGVDRA